MLEIPDVLRGNKSTKMSLQRELQSSTKLQQALGIQTAAASATISLLSNAAICTFIDSQTYRQHNVPTLLARLLHVQLIAQSLTDRTRWRRRRSSSAIIFLCIRTRIALKYFVIVNSMNRLTRCESVVCHANWRHLWSLMSFDDRRSMRTRNQQWLSNYVRHDDWLWKLPFWCQVAI